MQEMMQKWITWMKQLTEKGHIKDPGQPREHTGKLVKGKQKTVTDGPFAEAKDIISGYTLIEARVIWTKGWTFPRAARSLRLKVRWKYGQS
jgi:hypothetical protein